MEDGRFTLRLAQVDIQAEFEDTIYTYQALLRQEGIQLFYEPGDDVLPPIPGDAERLKQVFLQCAGQRRQAWRRRQTDRRGHSPAAEQHRDHRPGLRSRHPRGGAPLCQAEILQGLLQGPGSGIGLAVCDEIIQRHNGSFEIANASGGGALVTITLPTG